MTARLDEDGRCLATDLLPGQCGCPDHRGGESIGDLEAVHGQGLANRRRDTDDHRRDQWGSGMFLATYGGTCAWCEAPFRTGAAVRYDADDQLVGPCCAETDQPQPGLTHLKGDD